MTGRAETTGWTVLVCCAVVDVVLKEVWLSCGVYLCAVTDVLWWTCLQLLWRVPV